MFGFGTEYQGLAFWLPLIWAWFIAFAAAVSDRAYVIERGQIRFAGTIAALASDEAMREAYLGV